MNQKIQCNLCESYDTKLIDIVKDYNRWFKGEFKLYKCKKCWLVFLNPQINFEESMNYYDTDYYSKIDEWTIIKNIVKKFIFLLQKIYAEQPNIIGKTCIFSQYVRGIKTIPHGKYLDVGCGNGSFLYSIKKINPSWEYYGIDPWKFDEKDVQKHKLNIKKGVLEDGKYPDDFFDMITLNHVFEHVSDPSETLKELKRILKIGWILIIAVPNINSLAYKIFGKYFHQIDAPRHTYHYSNKTLKMYANKFNFKYLKTRYGALWDQTTFIISTFHYIGAIFKKKYWTNFLKKITEGNIYIIIIYILLYIIFTPITIILNLIKYGDNIEIWLEKK